MQKSGKVSLTDYELCVLCGKSSEYTIETDVRNRMGYVEGAGQLCGDCYADLYLKGKESSEKNAL